MKLFFQLRIDWIEDRILFLSKATEDVERFCAYFFNLLWALWKSRNEFCFEGNKEDPINILARAEIVLGFFKVCCFEFLGVSPGSAGVFYVGFEL
ncbi:uncharacterized protein G2W53_036908 [Senna tora]|uniref:Uncharacterized protein n=1 Tax=Senna tora TaxID=362788 RepID=A0A834SWQ2_9FABA|nr:uncharacterized protein G2W53_036908 [Senna tora]